MNTIIKFRATNEEKEAIISSALIKGFDTTTDYLKHLIAKDMNNDSTKPKTSHLVKKDNSSYHLSRIGNNINQLAYVVNKAALENKLNDKLAKEIAKELMYMNIQINKI